VVQKKLTVRSVVKADFNEASQIRKRTDAMCIQCLQGEANRLISNGCGI
jgi:hypothetical protein